MRTRRVLRNLIAALFVSLIGFLIFFYIVHSESPMVSYQHFMARDQSYYIKCATACDMLIEQLRAGGNSNKTIDGHDKTLPTVLYELHPSFVNVFTNQVSLLIGPGGRLSYVVVWVQSDETDTLWQLEVNVDGLSKAVFSTNRNELRNNRE